MLALSVRAQIIEKLGHVLLYSHRCFSWENPRCRVVRSHRIARIRQVLGHPHPALPLLSRDVSLGRERQGEEEFS
jgi:hypothetical protein